MSVSVCASVGKGADDAQKGTDGAQKGSDGAQKGSDGAQKGSDGAQSARANPSRGLACVGQGPSRGLSWR